MASSTAQTATSHTECGAHPVPLPPLLPVRSDHAPTPASSGTEPIVAQRSNPPDDAAGGQALPVGFRLDEFEIQARLGEGGFGIVYRAWDHSLGQMRAIKEYMPAGMARRDPLGGPAVVARTAKLREPFDKGLQRFIEEAQTLARFDHPALVRVLRRWEAHGTAYMAMPLYEGATLREHLRRRPERPSEAWLMQLLDPLTEALSVVHKHHWLHRDIAPDNILLLDGERPLLLDFGAARQVIGDATQELTAILKPGFAPVEQYGETPGLEQGPWTDVYALAATLHWAMLGQAPVASVSRVLVDNQAPLVDAARGRYSERFLAALDKALRVDARQRTQSMAALRADLGLSPLSSPELRAAAEPVAASTGLWVPTVLATQVATERLARAEPTAPNSAHTEPRTKPLAEPAEPVVVTLAYPDPDPASTPAPDTAREPSPSTARSTPPTRPVPVDNKYRSARWVALVGAAMLAALFAALFAAWRWDSSSISTPATQRGSAPGPQPEAASSPLLASQDGAVVFDLDGQLSALQAAANPARAPRVRGAPSQLSITQQQVLQFEVQSPQDGYLTLLVRGPDGTLTRLLANQAPLRVVAGQVLQIPPAGSDQLQAADPVGREDVLVVVSATPRDHAHLAAGREGSFEALHTGTAATERLRAWSGRAPLLAGRSAGPCEGASCEDFGVARFSVSVVR